MEYNSVYLVGFVLYVAIILLSYHIFGLSEAALVGIAGVAAPAIGLLVNGISLSPESSETDRQSKQHPFLEVSEERKNQSVKRLSDNLKFQENEVGKVESHLYNKDIKGADRKAMLYVFGQWAEAEINSQPTSIVNKHELRENTSLKGRSVGVFLDKMAHFIVQYYPEDLMEQQKMDEKDMEFELNENYLEEIVDYILGERKAPN